MQEIAALFIPFVLPITIVAMVLTYKLLKHRIDRQADSGVRQAKLGASAEGDALEKVLERAKDLAHRIDNLEDIIYDEGHREYERTSRPNKKDSIL